MDMSGMDDMPSTAGTSSMGGMKMYFHGSIGSDTFLFQSWVPTSGGAVAGICIAVFLLGIFERYLVALRRACDYAWRRGEIGLAVPRSKGTFTYQPASTSTESLSAPPAPTNSARPPPLSSVPSTSKLEVEAKLVPSSSQNSDGSDVEQGDRASPAYSRELEESMAHLPRAARNMSTRSREMSWSRPWRLWVDIPRGLLQALQTLIHYILMLTVMTFNIWFVISVVIGAGVGEMLFGRFGAGHGL